MAQKGEQTIYRNGGYKVVPIVVGYAVRGKDQGIVARFLPQEVAEAVELADELAEAEGFEAVA